MGKLRASDENLFEVVEDDKFFGVEDNRFSAVTACSERVDWCGQSRRAGDVVAVEVHESEQRLDVANCCWYGTGGEDAEFGGIGGDAGGIVDVPQIKNFFAKELTLRRFEFKAWPRMRVNTARKSLRC